MKIGMILLLALLLVPLCFAHDVPFSESELSYEGNTIYLSMDAPVWMNMSDKNTSSFTGEYISSNLKARNNLEECTTRIEDMTYYEDGDYSHFDISFECSSEIENVEIENSLFYDIFGYYFEQYIMVGCSSGKRLFYSDLNSVSSSFSVSTVCEESSEQAYFIYRNNTYGEAYRSIASSEKAEISFFNIVVDYAKSGKASLLLIILLSFVLGAMHTMSPGHGKSVIVSYLLGKHANVKNVLLIAVSTALTHISDVFVVSLLLLFLIPPFMKPILSEYLSIISAALILVFGIYLLVKNIRHHYHKHHHHHTRKGLVIAGVIVGLAPCPTAWALYLVLINMGMYFRAFISIVSFGLGLLLTISVLGILFIKAKKLLKFIPEESKLVKYLPLGSSILIIAIGLMLLVKNIL
ncbi:MAG: sulfite exporter TauE/SafE family protein [Candidatus Woesearchaeota archaeon]